MADDDEIPLWVRQRFRKYKNLQFTSQHFFSSQLDKFGHFSHVEYGLLDGLLQNQLNQNHSTNT
jgi:hypothetical protein